MKQIMCRVGSFDARFAAYTGAALAAAAGVGVFDPASAEGAFVYSGVKNIAVSGANAEFGLYIDFDTNQGIVASDAARGEDTLPGYDIDIFVAPGNDPTATNRPTGAIGVALGLFYPAGKSSNAEVASGFSPFFAAKLNAGAVIGASSSFTQRSLTRYSFMAYENTTGTGRETGEWNADATDKFLGVRFVNAAGVTNYGWVRLTVGEGPEYPFVVRDWAYDTTGASVVAGVIPEPATAGLALGALALGAVRRPRKR